MSGIRRIRSVYAEHYVQGSNRAKRTPRVGRPMRPRAIAWAGPAAFYQSRWSERNAWYKARIEFPEMLPEMYIIDPTDYYKSLEERLSDGKKRLSLDIGFSKLNMDDHEGKKKDPELERQARKNELLINLDEVSDNSLPIALHFNIFSDLFIDGAFFHNVQKLDVKCGDHSLRTGNVIPVSSLLSEPNVNIQTPENGKGFNTFVMVNLDGNLFESEMPEGSPKQVIHWAVGNITDGSGVTGGSDVIAPYLPPTPYHGTGFHRVAFVLFRHSERIDFSSFKLNSPEFVQRLFSTNRFLKTFEDKMTPSAIKFCQVEWDENVDYILHEQGLKSPRFWYEWNEPVKRAQKEFPLKPRPFDKYLDQYRPSEEVLKTVYREWLEKRVHEGKVEKAEYPDIFYAENKKKLPHWQHAQLMDKNVGRGPWARLYDDFQNPAFQKDQISRI
ncbi:unnamed protein product [Bursaphelenchus xylophilus]|uniref:Large ribosomal subunit protein mL38 n=1 Tax=Bursaphelenchus xylophilus TaxID=6326 RepID=A0A1I7RL51_BURXY|nr:unnamed protein product [Bursaphelenchus xylophilus]CAG9083454.1 unnamed protein product [Bursaphelenchus xylophilus]